MTHKILIACEASGVVTKAFRDRGYDAWSCDIIDTYGELPEYHMKADVTDVLNKGWDMMIAHPPCQYLANSGVSWLKRQEGRWGRMVKAAGFFHALLNAPIPHIAIENSVPHKYAVERIGRKYDMTIQPYQFGHKVSKRTCLWLQNLPELVPTTDLKAETEALPYYERNYLLAMSPGEDRRRKRSQTLEGIANAMADQWGKHLDEQRDS